MPLLKNFCENRNRIMIGTVINIAESAISDLSIGRIEDELPVKAGVALKRIVKPDDNGALLSVKMST